MAEGNIAKPLELNYATATDLNDATALGVYSVTTSVAHAPFDYAVVFVYTTLTGTWICQLCAGVINGKLAYRTCNAGTWSAWKEVTAV